jgi:SAM-dependent methyltransferase
MFTGINITYLAIYMEEIFTALKPGGYFVFDFFDLSEDEGWQHLLDNTHKDSPILNFSYHNFDTVEKLASQSGFNIINSYWTGPAGRRFLVAQKPST